ncbi:MAG: T9SS type A sorting domain-containing protein [candidate division KSB1 bacterium]|nr:T9SS type A sorting domain-containing protein [candidate division KSB1 bacterium]MDZ7272688.1 T9SS type A sorting domain-containing protein [candidate division KSB1 bacterium]MDZ7284290.1 T9SS type A sorting domain-containing protein [candidate division KSB1 bacterium]MDZ7297314.1 T9SS type A sorting domain-containing protein [candidate division KSB1 bacterium]MDZ7308382.1 T9SS type A sorting domain-containing protein [candidate division KSB1 bacterium]
MARDTTIAAKAFKVVATKSLRFNGTSLSFERVDTLGDVYKYDPSTQREVLLYRFSDLSRSFWPSQNHLARFDTSYTDEVFSKARKILRTNFYFSNDTTQLLFVYDFADSLGLIRSDFGHLQGTFLGGARINGVLYGTFTSVKEKYETPVSFTLYQNYPNPFRTSSTIEFLITNSSYVTLKVFDVLGREIISLIDAHLSAGKHKVVWHPERLAAGKYFYRLSFETHSKVRELTFQK